MKIHNVEQRSIEWFELKHGRIGGTTSSGLLLDVKDKFKIEMLSQYLEEFDPMMFDDQYMSDAMQRGIDLEPHARQIIGELTGNTFDEIGLITCDEIDILSLSPDGVNGQFTEACEIKCFGAKKHTECLITNEIPSEYIAQAIHYFTMIPTLEKLHWFAFRPESKQPYFHKILKRESKIDLGEKISVKIPDGFYKNGNEKFRTEKQSVLRPISEISEMVKTNAIELQDWINEKLETLTNQF